jgi:hypothetical protein
VFNLVAAGALVMTGAGVGLRAYLRSRITPAERERRRRAALVVRGKLGDATLLDSRDGMLHYAYDVRGVAYDAWQDITALQQSLPPSGDAIFGPVLVKYDAKNPANSIVLSEEWSGFRFTPANR